jgi:hypothetical protein
MSTDYNPFQSPTAPSESGGGVAWPIVPFESGHPRALVTIWLLAITAVICVFGGICSFLEYGSLQQQPNGSFTIVGTGAAIAESADLLSKVTTVVWIGVVIAFCMWTHRVARNLPALGGRGLKYTPGWAVGWFFIPIANLAMPYFVAAEIWRESDPEQRHLDGQEIKPASPLVAGWWTTYVIYAVVPTLVSAAFGLIIGFSIAARHGNPQEMVERIMHYLPTFLLIGLAAQTLGLLASILAIMYVCRVDANQQAKYESGPSQGFAG